MCLKTFSMFVKFNFSTQQMCFFRLFFSFFLFFLYFSKSLFNNSLPYKSTTASGRTSQQQKSKKKFKKFFFNFKNKMNSLEGQKLMRKSGEVVEANKVLEEKKIIAFYFSASWCPPCRDFTPILADFYSVSSSQIVVSISLSI